MTIRPEPFWIWPGWRQLGYAGLLALAVSVWFEIIYGGANFLAGQHSHRVRIHLDAELAVPLIPATVLLYMSLYLLFWAAPFILHSRHELKALTVTLAAVTLCAGIGFLFFPAETAFPPPGDMGIWTGLVRFARAVALRYNCVPSLHVALSVVCIGIFASRARLPARVLLWSWAVAICASTVLLHQHHLVDVITGFALGLAGVRWVYWRWTTPILQANLSTHPAPPA